MQQYIKLVFLLSVLSLNNFEHLVNALDFSASNILQSKILEPCEACKTLTDSFKKEVENTKRGKFEGGDSAWEEDKQKSYARSEVRLTEIQESLCKDVKIGQAQCHDLAAEYETTIEHWWFKQQDEHPDIYEYICVKYAKKCCPKDRRGPDCKDCEPGYVGETCRDCDRGYYEAYRDDNKVLCSKCHSSCSETCRGAGPMNCQGNCKAGWRKSDKEGCVDVNECAQSDKYCSDNKFCVNKEGSYSCLRCDKACDGCNGDGPDMCIKCAENYHRKDNICINSDILGRKQHENMARYATYAGLCIATCIILQRNIYLASSIGLMVGLYISVSEYMIANSDIQSATPNLDILDPQD